MPQQSTFASRGALVNRVALANPDYPLEFDQLVQSTDAEGQTVVSHRTGRDRTNTQTVDTPSRNYYGWDGRLRAVQRYRWTAGGQDGTWEEYRYDALGRRVLTIARPSGTPPGCAAAGMTTCAPLCSVVCIDAVTWARYDGAQLVQEERRAYPDGSVAPPAFGIVQYVSGLSLDAPLAVVRDGSALHVLTPSWRGRAESSVDATGAAMDESLVAVGGPSVRVAWPIGAAVYQRGVLTPNAALPVTWLGSAVTDQQDGTGYQYRRNRYYSPESGQFTQEDPIGLAGGMNLYGFAGGDPVNFSDPFGLCPPLEPCPVRAGTFMGAALNGIGNAISTWWDGHKDKVIMAVGMVLTEGRSEWEGLTPATLRGKSMQEVEEMVPQSWARQPTARGEGTRYVHPTNRGEQLRVQPGKASDPNPAKQGPYCRISQCGQTTDPIPLKGNPTLPPQE
jgi:RHS repeat-associated protein